MFTASFWRGVSRRPNQGLPSSGDRKIDSRCSRANREWGLPSGEDLEFVSESYDKFGEDMFLIFSVEEDNQFLESSLHSRALAGRERVHEISPCPR